MKNYLKLMRVEQYIKNLFVFAPLFFGREFLNTPVLLNVLLVFLCFCIASSSIYILNDYFDLNEDREHPEKSKRPLVSGAIKIKNAIFLMLVLMLSVLLITFLFSTKLFLIIATYIVINILYSKWLKHIPILDLNIIALGFVLRIFAGAAVTDILPSVWIVLITYLIALFLAIAKRRTDVILAKEGKEVRKNIDGYNLAFIDTVLRLLA